MNNVFYVDYYGETHYFKDCLYEFVMNLDRNIFMKFKVEIERKAMAASESFHMSTPNLPNTGRAKNKKIVASLLLLKKKLRSEKNSAQKLLLEQQKKKKFK